MSMFRLVIDQLGLALDAPQRQFLATLAVTDTVEVTDDGHLYRDEYARLEQAGFDLAAPLMRSLSALASQEAQGGS